MKTPNVIMINAKTFLDNPDTVLNAFDINTNQTTGAYELLGGACVSMLIPVEDFDTLPAAKSAVDKTAEEFGFRIIQIRDTVADTIVFTKTF